MLETHDPCLSDEALAAWASGSVGADELAACIEHATACERCGALIAELGGDRQAWVIGRYEIHGILGAGGMGVVLHARDPVLERDVAIKMIAARDADGETRARMLREARALAAIRHPNVVIVHDVGEVENEIFVAMERAVGTPLHWWQGASVAARLRALLGVADGLHAIHAAGLLHRDVKPANIIVTPGGETVVVDLGLAQVVATRNPHEPVAGTPGYIAPELLRGEAASVRSDEFGFWRIVAETFASAALSARQRAALARAVARGTTDAPEHRFGSLPESAKALRHAIAPPRRGWLIAGGLAVVVAAVAIPWWRASIAPPAPPACALALDGWSTADRAAAGEQLRAAGLDHAKVLAFIDREYDQARAIGERTCQQASTADQATRTTAIRQQLCVDQTWMRVHGNLQALRTPARVRHGVDELALGLPMSRCSDSTPPSTPAQPPREHAARIRSLFAQLATSGVESGSKPLTALEGSRAEVMAIGYQPLISAWHHEHAYWLVLAGKPKDALAASGEAARAALTAGDDLRYAIARLAELTSASTVGSASAALEGDVRAAVTRLGSPGLMASFQIALALNRLQQEKLDDARALLLEATATFDRIALAPHARQASAQQNLAVANQWSGDLEAAQRAADLASTLSDDRYGRDSIEALGARFARAANLLYRGKVDDAEREMRDVQARVIRLDRERSELGTSVAVGLCQLDLMRGVPATITSCTHATELTGAVFGADSPQQVAPMIQLAQYQLRADAKSAIATLTKALAIAARGSVNATDVPYARGLLALALHASHDHAAGRVHAREALPALRGLGQKDMVKDLERYYPEVAKTKPK